VLRTATKVVSGDVVMKPALNSLALACCTMFVPVPSAQSPAIRQGSNAAQARPDRTIGTFAGSADLCGTNPSGRRPVRRGRTYPSCSTAPRQALAILKERLGSQD